MGRLTVHLLRRITFPVVSLIGRYMEHQNQHAPRGRGRGRFAVIHVSFVSLRFKSTTHKNSFIEVFVVNKFHAHEQLISLATHAASSFGDRFIHILVPSLRFQAPNNSFTRWLVLHQEYQIKSTNFSTHRFHVLDQPRAHLQASLYFHSLYGPRLLSS